MPVSYELHERVAVLTFDDGKANVISHEALAELGDGFDRARADSGVGAVVLAGRPGRFSAGFDLDTMRSGAESMRGLVKAGALFTARLLTEPLPVVAACTGHALAAGALVLLAADHRVGASGDWKIGLNEVAIGMPLPAWAVELAACRLNPAEFERRAIFGQICNPDEAQRAGFLDEVVPSGAVVEHALAAATRLSGLSRDAVGPTKERARRALVRKMLANIDEDLADLSGPVSPGG